MVPNLVYSIVSLQAHMGGAGYTGGPARGSAVWPESVAVDAIGNLYIGQSASILIVPRVSGTYFGKAVSAGAIYTIAGGNGVGFAGDGGPAINATMSAAYSIHFDGLGNLLFADGQAMCVRMIPRVSGTYFGQSMTANNVYTVAGIGGTIGNFGYNGEGGLATASNLFRPFGLTIDLDGSLVFADYSNRRVRVVPVTGGSYYGQAMMANRMYTIAGFSGIGESGPAAQATLHQPVGIAVDASGNKFIADQHNQRVRMIPVVSGSYFGQGMTAGSIYTIAGTGAAGFSGDGGPATAAQLGGPYWVALDSLGNVLIADKQNRRVRMVARTAGTYYGHPLAVGAITTVAGNGVTGIAAGDGGPATSAVLGQTNTVTVGPSDHLYLADAWSVRVIARSNGTVQGQVVTTGNIYRVVGNGSPGTVVEGAPIAATPMGSVEGLTFDSSGNLYLAEMSAGRVGMVPALDGTYFGQAMLAGRIYTIAGNGTAASLGDGGIGTAASLYQPADVAVDGGGHVYISEAAGGRVRMLAPDGTIYTVAGSGASGDSGDGGSAVSATFSRPMGIALPPSGGLLVVDQMNHRVRKIQ